MKKALLAFLTAFSIFMLILGVFLIFTGGIWIYYGDFNIQQIPFYMHLHDLVRSGNFYYDWCTDLGGGVIGCYSFYILGSPFFWLTVPFRSEAVPYLIPWINGLKYGVMAMSSYMWLRRHVKTDAGAFMGAMLFTFSGFSGSVLVFNHFHDFVAFFPFWLMLFENMIERGKRIPYIFMTAFMVIINYYFFVGAAVFLVIFFFCRYTGERDGRRFAFVRRLLRALWCSVLGVLLSAWYLIPATYYTMGNSRLSKTLIGYDLVSYNEPSMLLGIVKNTVMLSDISGLNSMFNKEYSRVSGVAAYLPLVSVSCVIAYFLIYKGRHEIGTEWPKRVMIVSLIFAAVPGLNGMFSAFNSEYYARWYYMPILVMALISARILEEFPYDPSFKIPVMRGNIFVAGCIAFFAVCSVLPAHTKEEELTILGALKSPEQLITQFAFSIVMTVAFFLLITFVFPKIEKLWPAVLSVTLAALITAATMMTEGEMLVDMDRKEGFISQGIEGTDKLKLPKSSQWSRIETEQDVFNYPMIWNIPTNTAFISTVPPSIMDFYEGIGLSRKVTSRLDISRMGTRTLMSQRYLLKEKETAIETIGHLEDDADLSKFLLIKESNGFEIYENNYFVPMGFSFDEYVTEEEFNESRGENAVIDRALMKYLVLSEEDAEKYGRYMQHCEEDNIRSVSYQVMATECSKRSESACTEFKPGKKGFTANAHMRSDNLLFFSVPYDDGFTAFVDGKETKIVKADFGFSAVFVEEGDHTVELKYDPFFTLYKKFFDGFLKKD